VFSHCCFGFTVFLGQCVPGTSSAVMLARGLHYGVAPCLSDAHNIMCKGVLVCVRLMCLLSADSAGHQYILGVGLAPSCFLGNARHRVTPFLCWQVPARVMPAMCATPSVMCSAEHTHT
jgi:hypothetical protein